MPSLVFVALVSLFLFGCSGVKEQQNRAADFVESAADGVKNLTTAFSGATEKMKATVSNVQKRAEEAEAGAKNVADGFSKLKAGVEDMQKAVGGK